MEKTCEVVSKPKSFKEFLLSPSFKKPALGVLIGGILGFAYYFFIGCSSGSCPISSNPYISTFYGSIMGLLFVKRPCANC